METEKETLRIPLQVLRQIKDVLNQVANARSDLDKKIVLAVNSVRYELFAFFPMDSNIAVRSTKGPSYDEVFRNGFRFGARAVVANRECADLGRSGTQAFGIAVAWLRRRQRVEFAKLVDGADPEYHELVQAFAKGIEMGVNQFLGFVREDHKDQDLPEF